MIWWIFIVAIVVWQNIANICVEASTNSAKATKVQACTTGQLTLYCETDRNANAIQDFEWKIKFNDNKWIDFSSCSNNSGVFYCSPLQTATLPVGMTLLNNSNGAVTIARSNSASHDHAQIMCQVHYFDHSPSWRVYEINFTAQCVRIQEGRDLNLTRIMSDVLPCKRVVDVEWYSVNRSRFAYCNACRVCTITKENRHSVPVFWNRLQITEGCLMLTGIQESDHNQKIIVKVHTKSHTQLAQRRMDIPLVYTIRIFVKSGHDSQGSKIALPTVRPNSSSLPPSRYTRSPKGSSASTAHGQKWAVVVMAIAILLDIVFGS